jgi:hypothetical protein
VAGTCQPLGPWFDITRRLSMPKDLLFLNRITIGVSSILGHLYATADWKSIDSEIRHDGRPTTELGRLEAAWRARRDTAAGSGSTSAANLAEGTAIRFSSTLVRSESVRCRVSALTRACGQERAWQHDAFCLRARGAGTSRLA